MTPRSLPQPIRRAWRSFEGFPMETLTKAWYKPREGESPQRSVALMREHRRAFGASGNCFDLTLWLLEELAAEGVEAYPIGGAFFTPEAHAAVIALDQEGERYLCDLGDLWIEPFPLDRSLAALEKGRAPAWLPGYFPAADLRLEGRDPDKEGRSDAETQRFSFLRPDGSVSAEDYDLRPVSLPDFLAAAEHSQRLLRRPLCEIRVRLGSETAHWEFEDGISRLSTKAGLLPDRPLDSRRGMALLIESRTGISAALAEVALERYAMESGPGAGTPEPQ